MCWDSLQEDDKKLLDEAALRNNNKREFCFKVIFPFAKGVSYDDRGSLTRRVAQMISDDAKFKINDQAPTVRLEVKPERKPRNAAIAIMIATLDHFGLQTPLVKFDWSDPFTIYLKQGVTATTWPQHLDPTWPQHSNNIWTQHGHNMATTWPQHGPNIWTQHLDPTFGPNTATTWQQHGHNMAQTFGPNIWTQHGHNMAQHGHVLWNLPNLIATTTGTSTIPILTKLRMVSLVPG